MVSTYFSGDGGAFIRFKANTEGPSEYCASHRCCVAQTVERNLRGVYSHGVLPRFAIARPLVCGPELIRNRWWHYRHDEQEVTREADRSRDPHYFR